MVQYRNKTNKNNQFSLSVSIIGYEQFNPELGEQKDRDNESSCP